MIKIAILASGNGTNAQQISEYFANNEKISIECIIYNRKDAYVAERAKKLGIPAVYFGRKDFFENGNVLAYLKEKDIDWVILAGFLWLIPEDILASFPNRIINIHPALIPSFCGAGMYGIKPHKAALARGVKVSGATVHFVNENYDDGPILLQKSVDVLPGDTPETLQKRIMQECEWKILPKAIRLIADGKVSIENNIAYVTE